MKLKSRPQARPAAGAGRSTKCPFVFSSVLITHFILGPVIRVGHTMYAEEIRRVKCVTCDECDDNMFDSSKTQRQEREPTGSDSV